MRTAVTLMFLLSTAATSTAGEKKAVLASERAAQRTTAKAMRACEAWRSAIKGRPKLTAKLEKSADRVHPNLLVLTTDFVPGRKTLILDETNTVVGTECG